MVAAYLVASLSLALAQSPGAPQPVVGVGRVEAFLLELGPFTPKFVYPEGKISDIAVRQALHEALTGLGEGPGPGWWRAHLRPAETIGIQIDCSWPPVSMPLVDVVVDELVRAGANPNRIYVFAGDERQLYQAGLAIRNETTGIKVVGTTSEGFRGGLSRIVLDYCDVVVNVARLRADRQLGLWGCVANHTVCVDYPARLAALRDPDKLLEIASRATLRLKTRLHILDALQPPYEPAPDHELPPRWPYGGLIASPDPVAADLVGQRLLEAYRAEAGIQPIALQPAPAYLEKACTEARISTAIPGPIAVTVSGYQEDALIE